MDYQNLLEEMKKVTNQNERSLLSISKLNSFMQDIHSSIRTALNSLILKIDKETTKFIESSIITKNIYLLINYSHQNSIQATKLLDSFQTNIIDTLNSLYENQSFTFKETKKQYYALVNDLFKTKQSLENARLFYYNAAHFSRMKKKGSNDKEKLSETIFERIYYYEYVNCNKKLQESNSTYADIINHQKQNEESKIKMIQTIINEYVILLNEMTKLIEELIDTYTKLFSSVICDQERELLKKKMSVFVDASDETYKSRFKLEKYIGYSEYSHNNLEEVNFPSSFEDFSFADETEDYSNEIIDKIQCKLYSKEEVDSELLISLLKHLRNRPNEIGKLFLESFGDQQWYVCYNYNNLLALMTIFLFISNHFNSETIEEYKHKGIQNINQYQELIEVNKINQRIISLAQKIYIQYNNEIQDKVYLSALLLKQNKVYQKESFWKKTLIISFAEMVYSHYILIVKNKPKEEIEMEYLKASCKGSDKAISTNSNLIMKIGMKIKSSNRKLKGILNTSNIYVYFPQFDKLSKAEILSLEDYLSSEIKKEGFLEEYLMDLSSFNFPIEKIIELLTQLCKELNLSTEYFSFYISFSNVCSYTIRKRIPKENNYLDYVTAAQIVGQERKVKLISFGLSFLEWKDYYNLMGLNKYYHKHISKKIYKIVLNNPKIKMEIRLHIWDAILNIKSLRKKYHYASLLKKVSLNLDLKTRKEIEVDIPRTFIGPSLNKDEARDSLENILIAIAQVNEDTKYCQGMNYIAQFLLEITNDEERTFFFFLGIFKSTDYARIFSRNPSKYKVFFYIFNRLLMLYEPEISYVLNKNGIDVYYFLAPCFYTLFQNVRENIKEQGTPLVLLKIFDGCLTSGWKSLMKVGLNLLHYNTTKILHMKIEDLLDFITQTIFTIDFFENSHLETFDKFQAIKLPKNLLNYIDQEYSHELKLQKKIKEG